MGAGLEVIPSSQHFVDRRTELVHYQQQLATQNVVVIQGMVGAGKSILGAKLVSQYMRKDVFWLSLWPTLNDRVDVILGQLANFFAAQGDRTLQDNLQRYGNPFSELYVGHLVQTLAQHHYTLCFDNFHVLEENYAVQQLFRHLFQQIYGEKDCSSQVILMSRRCPSFVDKDAFQSLRGFDRQGANEFLLAQGMQVPLELFEALYRETEGNPLFLQMFVRSIRRDDTTAHTLSSAIAQFPEQRLIENYLRENLFRELNEKERLLCETIAQNTTPIQRGTIVQTGGEEGATQRYQLLNGLLRKHVIWENDDRLITMHPCIRRFFYRRCLLKGPLHTVQSV